MNLESDTFLSESTNFTDFELSSVDTTDELESVFASTTRIGLEMHGSDWLPCSHCISEATSDRVNRKKAKNHYNFKSGFETNRDKVVDQDNGRQNNPMNLSTSDSTPLDANTTNGTT